MISVIAFAREDAKALGLKRFFTGERCKQGHVAERYTINGCCVACNLERASHYQKTEHAREVKSRLRREPRVGPGGANEGACQASWRDQ